MAPKTKPKPKSGAQEKDTYNPASSTGSSSPTTTAKKAATPMTQGVRVGTSTTLGSGYATGTALNPNYNIDSTAFEDTPLSQLFSQNPTQMASAWGLPANAGALSMSSGFGSTSTPANTQDQNKIDRGVAQVTLYAALDSGKPLTAAELRSAQQMGGDVARAAELVGTAQPKQPAHPATGYNVMPPTQASRAEKSKAVIAAQQELAQRIQTNLGIPASDLLGKGLSQKVPKQLANMMQNAGYPVMQSMTLEQAIGVAGGSKGAPSNVLNTPQTVSQFIQSLTNGQNSASQIYSLQQELYKGGFYDEEYTDGTKSYTQGQLDTGTILAFRNAILQTLQDNANGKNVTLQDVIKQGDTANPLLGQVQSPSNVALATPGQLQGTLESSMEQYLGRLPTQSELQGFTSYLDSLEEQGSKGALEEGESPSGLVDYNTGVPYLPKVPTPAQAAETYVQNSNPAAYQGHNVANAFGLLMNLIDRQSTSSLDTIGARPTTTT